MVHFGFRRINAGSDVRLCLDNTTMVGLRQESVQSTLMVSHVNQAEIEDYTLGRDHRYFSVTEQCIELKGNSNEFVNTWMIPPNVCPGQNIVNVYGYSYEYNLKLSSSKVICLFFSSISSRHHINLRAWNSNTSFTAQFYTGTSLTSTGEPVQSVSTSLSCSFSAMEPFFVRLTTGAAKAKRLHVSMVSLHLPTPSMGCRNEEVVEFNGNREPASVAGISDELCRSPGAEFGSFIRYIVFGAALLSVAGVILQGLGWVNWGRWCQKHPQRFQELAADAIAHEVANPSDVLHHEEEEEEEVQSGFLEQTDL